MSWQITSTSAVRNSVNFHWQYGISFYLTYLSRWPDLCSVQEAPSGRMMGYSSVSPPRLVHVPILTTFPSSLGH